MQRQAEARIHRRVKDPQPDGTSSAADPKMQVLTTAARVDARPGHQLRQVLAATPVRTPSNRTPALAVITGRRKTVRARQDGTALDSAAGAVHHSRTASS